MRPTVEHRTDPGRRILGDHAGDASIPSPGAGDLVGPRDRVRDRAREPQRPARPAAHPGADGLLVPGLHAPLAPEGSAAGPGPPALAAAPGVDRCASSPGIEARASRRSGAT